MRAASETWLLDANVLTFLFAAEAEDAIDRAGAQGLSLAVPQRVLDELRRTDPGRQPWASRARTWVPPGSLQVIDLEVDSDVYRRWVELRARYAASGGTRDDGEHVCIALAMGDPSMVFVAHDKNALWRAVHEIRPSARIASAAVFFDRLHACGAIDQETRDKLGALCDAKHLPSWWGDAT